MLLSKPVWMPAMAVPINVTATMPMITPSAVNIERVLLDFICANAIFQVSGWFVRQDDGGIVDQGARDRDALALAARQLVRLVEQTVAQADVAQTLRRPLFARLGIDPRVNQRQLHVPQTGGAREKIEGLENKSDLAVPDRSQLVIIHRGNILAVEFVTARARRIKTAEHIHESRFTTAARPH